MQWNSCGSSQPLSYFWISYVPQELRVAQILQKCASTGGLQHYICSVMVLSGLENFLLRLFRIGRLHINQRYQEGV